MRWWKDQRDQEWWGGGVALRSKNCSHWALAVRVADKTDCAKIDGVRPPFVPLKLVRCQVIAYLTCGAGGIYIDILLPMVEVKSASCEDEKLDYTRFDYYRGWKGNPVECHLFAFIARNMLLLGYLPPRDD